MSGNRKVRLTKKFAQFLDGIDLSRVAAGEHIELSDEQARILIAEGWAQPIAGDDRAVASDTPPRRPRRAKGNRRQPP